MRAIKSGISAYCTGVLNRKRFPISILALILYFTYFYAEGQNIARESLKQYSYIDAKKMLWAIFHRTPQ